MRTKLRGFIGCLVLFSATMPLAAHHSFAVDYDVKKPVKLQGVVTMIQWTNPHAHVYLDVVENGVKRGHYRFSHIYTTRGFLKARSYYYTSTSTWIQSDDVHFHITR